MAWFLIIGTILSLCHISPAGAFSPFILSGFRSVWSCSNCMFHCKPRRSDKTSLQLSTLSIHTARPQPGSPVPNPSPLQSRPQPRVVAGCSHLTSPHTPSPSHHRNHQRAPLKFPRYMPQWRVLYIPAESERHTDNPLQPSPLMPWTPELGSRKQVSEVWREQKQLWEACLHWPVVTGSAGGGGQERAHLVRWWSACSYSASLLSWGLFHDELLKLNWNVIIIIFGELVLKKQIALMDLTDASFTNSTTQAGGCLYLESWFVTHQ